MPLLSLSIWSKHSDKACFSSASLMLVLITVEESCVLITFISYQKDNVVEYFTMLLCNF